MKLLAIIGIIMVVVGFVLALESDPESKKTTHKITAFVFLYVGMILIVIGVVFTTFQDALDSNPYAKEYLYKQSPSGEMEKCDSVYVRIKKAK